jgi:hypothetical protein
MKKLFLLTFLLISCGGENYTSSLGGAEIGNPSTPTREVSGLIAGDTCVADEVVATDSSNQSTRDDIDQNCAFNLTLTTSKAYNLSFNKESNFVASMVFDGGSSGLESPSFYLSESENQVDLGEIIIEGNEAYPTHQPSLQNDRDQDGINDFEDEDDDNDGKNDDLEIDCNLDGFLDEDEDECEEENNILENENINDDQIENDDDDEDNDENEEDENQNSGSENGQNRTLEVIPRNQSNHVNLDKVVKVRMGCKLNPQSLDENSFSIQANDEVVFCQPELKANNMQVECRIEGGFIPASEYHINLSGMECFDGEVIPEINWQFETDVGR